MKQLAARRRSKRHVYGWIPKVSEFTGALSGGRCVYSGDGVAVVNEMR